MILPFMSQFVLTTEELLYSERTFVYITTALLSFNAVCIYVFTNMNN